MTDQDAARMGDTAAVIVCVGHHRRRRAGVDMITHILVTRRVRIEHKTPADLDEVLAEIRRENYVYPEVFCSDYHYRMVGKIVIAPAKK